MTKESSLPEARIPTHFPGDRPLDLYEDKSIMTDSLRQFYLQQLIDAGVDPAQATQDTTFLVVAVYAPGEIEPIGSIATSVTGVG
jgi:hypothetical protein